MSAVATGTGAILDRALAGERIDDVEAVQLLESRDLIAIGRVANELRARHTDPDRITFIVDRNVNYTNVCVTDCDFCAFYRRPGDRREGYLLPKPVIYKKIEETIELGGTGLLMQGGHHPDLLELEEALVASVRAARAEPETLAFESAERYGYPAGFLARYFEKLRYRFGPRERAGLYTFLELARDVGELDRVPELRFVPAGAAVT